MVSCGLGASEFLLRYRSVAVLEDPGPVVLEHNVAKALVMVATDSVICEFEE